MNRLAAFLPAVVLGLAAGLGINAWRHRGHPPGPAPVEPSRASANPPVPPVVPKTLDAEPPVEAAELAQQFSAITAASPLRYSLARESFAAGLTFETFTTLVNSGKVPPELWSTDALREHFRQWAKRDRRKSVDLALSAPKNARGCLDEALKGLTAAEFRTLMGEWAGPHYPTPVRKHLFQESLAAVARRDPAGALSMLSELPLEEKDREQLATSTYAALLRIHEEHPAEWAQTFGMVLDTARALPPDKLDRFLSETLSGLNAERAAAAWPAISAPEMSARIQREFLQKWSHSDPVAALVKAVEHFPPASADREAQRLYSSLATQAVMHLQLLDDSRRRDAQAYLQLAEDVPAGPGRDAFIAGVVDQVASGTPALAAQMLPQVPQEHRAQTINMIAELWTASDAVAASQWVDSLPAGTERDQAAGGLVRRLAESDPERAAQWAVTIQDESNRRHALQKVHQTWQRLDPAAAARWVQSEGRLTTEDHALLSGER